MSTIGDIIDQANAIISAQVFGATVERGFRTGMQADPSDFPFCTIHSPIEVVERLEYAQEDLTLGFFADLWTADGDQDTIIVNAEAIKAAVRADVTMGALVLEASVSLELFEFPDKSLKVMRMTFDTRRVI